MRQPPSWTEFFRYPVISGIALLATGVTVAGWAKLDVTPLVENAITSIFPHVGILHLIFNVYWLWVFGTLIEEVYGHVKTVALVLLFAIVPNALEYAFSAGGVGLSGVGYGLFGLLWILSKRDERFRDAIDQRTIRLFVIWFFFCILATVTNLMLIGNIAHGAGAVLGILTGFAITMPERRATITAGIGSIFVFAIWASTFGRPSVNLSAYGSYDECKWGYDAMRSNHNDEALKWLQIAARYRSNPASCLTDLGFTYQRLGKTEQALSAYRKAADMGYAEGQYYLGTLYENGSGGAPKDAKQAVYWYRKAAEHGAPDELNNVAWALATSPDPSVRNPVAALEYARKAIAAEKDHPSPHVLDTLAEAYYVNGQYEDAVKTEQRALELLTGENKNDYLKQLDKYQLALVNNKQPPMAK
jgi:membrane associated rhomboid family serine protease/TPR repeat protein